MFPNKNERLALYSAMTLFALLAVQQLWRAFAQLPVVVNGQTMPLWPSYVVGIIAVAMVLWLMTILQHHRTTA